MISTGLDTMLIVNLDFVGDFNEFKTTDQFYERYPCISILPSSFVSSFQNVELYDVRKSRVLHVMQHEYAIVNAKNSNIDTIITDDMTTCVAVILRSHHTSAICLCHVDRIDHNVDTQKFKKICEQMCGKKHHSTYHPTSTIDYRNQEIAFDLFIIGGYKDERNISDRLVIDILTMFNRIRPYLFHIRLIHVGTQNTLWQQKYPVPKLTGVAVTVSNCLIRNALLARPLPIDSPMDRLPIPLYSIRRISISFNSSSEYISIYNLQEEKLQIPVLHIKRCYFSPSAKKYFEETLKFNDQEILNHFSTSPMVEPEHFVPEMRQIFQTLYNHLCRFGYDSNDQFVQQYFPQKRPRIFSIEPNDDCQRLIQQMGLRFNLIEERECKKLNENETTIRLKFRYINYNDDDDNNVDDISSSSSSSLTTNNRYVWKEIFK